MAKRLRLQLARPSGDGATVQAARLMTAADRWIFDSATGVTNVGVSPRYLNAWGAFSPVITYDALTSISAGADLTIDTTPPFVIAASINWHTVYGSVWARLDGVQIETGNATQDTQTVGYPTAASSHDFNIYNAYRNQENKWRSLWIEFHEDRVDAYCEGEHQKWQGTNAEAVKSGSLTFRLENGSRRTRDLRIYDAIPTDAEREQFLRLWYENELLDDELGATW